KTDLLTKQGILKHWGFFFGRDKDIPKFLFWLQEENESFFAHEIEHYGIIDEKYYDTSSNVICGKNDLFFKNISDIGKLSDDEKIWLKENLLNIRKDKIQSLVGLCWAVGRFHQDGSYPILEVCGTTSIGKTEFIGLISRIMFGTDDNIKAYKSMSNHQVRSLASCSNITPLCIDEIKILANKKNIQIHIDLFSVLRSAYDNKLLNQGNITEKLKEFKLCTPTIISGESGLSDVAHLDG
ncbi:MAG: toprim domain-containing protein, partial [Fusobacteriaceae bacterium]